MAGRIVVVTGANGFVASWIVKKLLERGYNVRGTVRNPNDENKVGHLLKLPGATERLVLYEAELTGDGAYDEAVDGADYVIHTAQPILSTTADPMKEVVDPAVEGTLSVLKSAAKAKTVKRVVYTSSIAAMVFGYLFLSRKEDDVVDESWWSDDEFCKKSQMWYCVAKLRAERAAFQYVKDTNAPFDVVAINPCTSIGALLQNRLNVNFSSNEVKRMLDGVDWRNDPMSELRQCGLVDVEDVALAHILAMENPKAKGRYLLCESGLSQPQLAFLLSKLYPDYTALHKPDLKGMDEVTFMKPAIKISNEKIKDLGLTFTPPQEYIKKCVESFKQMGEL